MVGPHRALRAARARRDPVCRRAVHDALDGRQRRRIAGVTAVAVVGTGFGCLTHVRALRNAGFDVVALVGRDPAKTKSRAERFAIAEAATSLEAVLDKVDAVTIATPPHTHAD